MVDYSVPFPHRRRRSRALQIRITPDQRDFLTFTLWCVVTFVQFPYDELLLYPLALYYAWAIWRDQARIAPLLARAWIVLLYPIWCLISPVWAVVPTAALKHSIYLILTMMICFQVAATMEPRRILYALLLATGVIGIINLGYGFATGNLRNGIFPQKNTMGKNMVVLWVISSAVLLDRGSSWWIRILGAGLAVAAAFMALLSESATAVLLVLATGMLNVIGALFLLGGFFRPSKIAAFCFCLAGLAVIGALILPSLQSSPVDAVLNQFGKDSTLTGRTVLWEYAEEQIAERPYLGVGADGFWRYHTSPLVQKIYAEFHKYPGDRFNFHNSYYEIAVHQGLIGLSFAMLAMIWGLYQVTRGVLALGTLPHVYFFTQTLTVLVRTTTEADFYRPFVLFHMIFWIGALVTVRGGLRRRHAAHLEPSRSVAR